MRPRIRTVKPEMRHDERYARLSYAARELFNGLITMADDEGRFRALTSQIAGHIFPYDVERDLELPARVREWIGEIKDSGMVLFYVADGVPYGAFRNWARHQQINRPTPSDLPPPPSPKVVRENSLVRASSGAGWKQALRSSESSLINHGELTEASVRPQAPRGSDPFPEVVVRLTERLAARVRANDPKFDTAKASSRRWLTDMSRLLKDRNGDESEISRVIDFCGRDPFERSNVLSPGKLRARFTALLLKANAGNGNVVSMAGRPQRDLSPYARAAAAKTQTFTTPGGAA